MVEKDMHPTTVFHTLTSSTVDVSFAEVNIRDPPFHTGLAK